MRERLLRWFAWSVLFSALPYLFGFLAAVLGGKGWQPSALFADGKLLLSTVALLAAALKEIASMRTTHRFGGRETILFIGIFVAIVAAFLYGCLAYSTQQEDPQTTDMAIIERFKADQERVRHFTQIASYVAVGFGLVLGAVSVAVATPLPSDDELRATGASDD